MELQNTSHHRSAFGVSPRLRSIWGARTVGWFAFLVVWQALFQAAAVFGVTTYVSVFFLPAGLNVAFLLLFGPRVVPVLILASLIAGVPYWLPDRPLTWIATATAVGVGYGCGIGWYRWRITRFSNPSRTLVICWLCAVAPLTVFGNATLMGVAYYATGATHAADALHHASLIWVGDLVGIFTVTPAALLACAALFPEETRRQLPWLRLAPLPSIREVLLHTAVLLLALIAVYALPHALSMDARLWHLLFIPAIWIALAKGLPSALLATSTLNVGNVAVATLFGTPIALPELQSLMLGISATTLILGAMATDRAQTIGNLAATVDARTRELSTANQGLLSANQVLYDQSQALRQTLEDVSAAHTRLQETQQQLIEAEKFAALGQLVAGIAHEINSPLGVALTAASYLSDETEQIRVLARAGQLRRAAFDDYTAAATEATDLLLANLRRAADLVHSFKLVAADQTSDERRRFTLDECLDDIARSLSPLWQKAGHTLTVSCPSGIEVDGYPGALAQILTNLITNSLIHGFKPGQAGRIAITVTEPAAGTLDIVYSDNGQGIPTEHLPSIFDPFFTTGRARGCTGLGLHIAHNLAVRRMGGSITATSTPNAGVCFVLNFPRTSSSVP
ncbi:ATP-binding protein [Azospirillum brasilense]|uniref:histidine kinase n=1 Tax=Azospirillum brasilense TaxID=192 RepID=A0A235H9S4_AZOBR|nr:ATP-binding protein [Azospirillum brasilense]OYD82580.1 hypothetical protein CHT98_20525 [Azospirillum brasilense]